jgi:hypothetical protein
MGKSQVTADQVLHLHKNWRGTGGRSTLYNLAKRHEITLNEAYVILSSPIHIAVKRAEAGKKFAAYREV